MEQLGKVTEWNDDRGFGFIAPLGGELARVFFHVRDYRLDGRRPEVGELVKYNAHRQPDGKWRAQAVHRTVPATLQAKRMPGGSPSSRSTTAVPGALATVAYGAAVAWAIHSDLLPFETVFILLGMSVVTFMAYALDKHAAQHGRRRTPESTLHLLEFVGGWPGALVAQQVLRHKSSKPDYRAALWTMVVLHSVVLGAWAWTRA